jgi:phosphoribosylformylglycinamidine synthase (EC 6.3.5.3)
MFGSLSGDKLGIWVAHGEGRFYLPEPEDHYNIIAKYNYAEYPGNPNGSDYNSRYLLCRWSPLGYDATLGACHLPMAERLVSSRSPQRRGNSLD